MKRRFIPLIVFLSLALTGAVCYFPVIDGPFIFDDNLLVEHNQFIRSFEYLPKVFRTSSTGGASLGGSNFYRPFQPVIYMIIYHYFGMQPAPFHLVSILFHIINAFLVFLLLGKKLLSRTGALIASVIFLVHPVQAEAVGYISGIADPMGLMFLLAGLISFQSIFIVRRQKRNKDVLLFMLSLLFFISALMSKESTIVFFPLSALIAFFHWKELDKQDKKPAAAFLFVLFCVALTYLYLKFKVFTFTGVISLTDRKNIYTENLHIRIITFISVLWEYFKMLTMPIHLYLERPYTAFADLSSFQGFFGLLVIGLAFIAALRSLKTNRIVFFGVAWFFMAIAPLSGIVPLNAMYLEHWLYVPIIGIAILIGYWHDRIRNRTAERLFFILLGIAILGFIVRTMLRNEEWSDPVKFYQNEISYNPNSARLYNNLAMTYADEGRLDKAIKNYKKAIAVWDVNPESHHNLANAYWEQGKLEMAEEEYFRALELDPNFIYSHLKLYKLYYEKGDYVRAEAFIKFTESIQNGNPISFDQIERVKKLNGREREKSPEMTG